MKTLVAITKGCDDRPRIVHQAIDVIMRGIARIGPRACRIAALAWRDRAIAGITQRLDLRAPAMHRFGKAMQQQHQWRARRTGDEGVEGEVRGNPDCLEFGHGSDFTFQRESRLRRRADWQAQLPPKPSGACNCYRLNL